MKQNKNPYLTPKVSVVAFKVENGFQASDKIKTEKPQATSYQDVDQSYNDWGTLQ